MAATGTQLDQKPEVSRPALIAPLWHTALILFLLLVPLSAWLPLKSAFPSIQRGDRPFLYMIQLEWQWIVCAIVYLGLLVRGTRLRDLIGGKWSSARDFFRDLGLGIVCSAINIVLALILVLVIKPRSSPPDSLDPRGFKDLLGLIPIVFTAGFMEELTCRGYLQRQFHALTGNPATALVLQAVVFSAAHGYRRSIADVVDKFLFGRALACSPSGARACCPACWAMPGKTRLPWWLWPFSRKTEIRLWALRGSRMISCTHAQKRL
jgi:membrane protease YdiL (CAAX protease family)